MIYQYIQLSGYGTTFIFLLNVKVVHIPCISVALPTKGKFIFDLCSKNNKIYSDLVLVRVKKISTTKVYMWPRITKEKST